MSEQRRLPPTDGRARICVWCGRFTEAAGRFCRVCGRDKSGVARDGGKRRRRARWPLTTAGTAVLLPFAVGFVLAWATGLLGLWPW